MLFVFSWCLYFLLMNLIVFDLVPDAGFADTACFSSRMDESFSKENFILLLPSTGCISKLGWPGWGFKAWGVRISYRTCLPVGHLCFEFVWVLSLVHLGFELCPPILRALRLSGPMPLGKGTAVPLPRYLPSPRSQPTVPPCTFSTLIN